MGKCSGKFMPAGMLYIRRNLTGSMHHIILSGIAQPDPVREGIQVILRHNNDSLVILQVGMYPIAIAWSNRKPPFRIIDVYVTNVDPVIGIIHLFCLMPVSLFILPVQPGKKIHLFNSICCHIQPNIKFSKLWSASTNIFILYYKTILWKTIVRKRLQRWMYVFYF